VSLSLELFERIYLPATSTIARTSTSPATASHRFLFERDKIIRHLSIILSNWHDARKEVFRHMLHVGLDPHRMEWLIMPQVLEVKRIIFKVCLERVSVVYTPVGTVSIP